MCDAGQVDVVTTVIVAAATASGLLSATTQLHDPVQWNKGSGPVQMKKGLPNPPGWYRAAVGKRPQEKVLFLTFDDGPSGLTRGLLKSLKKYHAHATFFVTGNSSQSQRKLLGKMRKQGHAVGNHTWSHPRLTSVPTRRVKSELGRTSRVIGPAASPCMRPPYGLINERVARASLAAGLQPVLWTAHIEDWAPHSLSWTIQRLHAATKPGAVILMHDTHPQTVAAVRAVLPRWSKMGYRFAVIPACETS